VDHNPHPSGNQFSVPVDRTRASPMANVLHQHWGSSPRCQQVDHLSTSTLGQFPPEESKARKRIKDGLNIRRFINGASLSFLPTLLEEESSKKGEEDGEEEYEANQHEPQIRAVPCFASIEEHSPPECDGRTPSLAKQQGGSKKTAEPARRESISPMIFINIAADSIPRTVQASATRSRHIIKTVKVSPPSNSKSEQ
jgi:hypothetical protein